MWPEYALEAFSNGPLKPSQSLWQCQALAVKDDDTSDDDQTTNTFKVSFRQKLHLLAARKIASTVNIHEDTMATTKKLASLKAKLVRNYDPPTEGGWSVELLTWLKTMMIMTATKTIGWRASGYSQLPVQSSKLQFCCQVVRIRSNSATGAIIWKKHLI